MYKKRADDVEHLLKLLTLFPGLTQRALTSLHQIAPSLLYRCIDQGLITAREEVIGTRNGKHHVFRFYATKPWKKPSEDESCAAE
jgi:hypothetical protein